MLAHSTYLILIAYCNQNTSTCVATSCLTGTKDGDETSLDCGGSYCTPCGINKPCVVDRDCITGVCMFDPRFGGSSSCGTLNLCYNCSSNIQCWTNICSSTTHVCVQPVGGECAANSECQLTYVCSHVHNSEKNNKINNNIHIIY